MSGVADHGDTTTADVRYMVVVDGGGLDRTWTYADRDDAYAKAQAEHDDDGAFVLVSRHDENGAMTLGMWGRP